MLKKLKKDFLVLIFRLWAKHMIWKCTSMPTTGRGCTCSVSHTKTFDKEHRPKPASRIRDYRKIHSDKTISFVSFFLIPSWSLVAWAVKTLSMLPKAKSLCFLLGFSSQIYTQRVSWQLPTSYRGILTAILIFMAKVLDKIQSCSWMSSGMVTSFEIGKRFLKDGVVKAKEVVVQGGLLLTRDDEVQLRGNT